MDEVVPHRKYFLQNQEVLDSVKQWGQEKFATANENTKTATQLQTELAVTAAKFFIEYCRGWTLLIMENTEVAWVLKAVQSEVEK